MMTFGISVIVVLVVAAVVVLVIGKIPNLDGQWKLFFQYAVWAVALLVILRALYLSDIMTF